jgi:exonuclease SbcC
MITKVIIENFQSHKRSEMEFVPGTNVIIGASDSGKSAIFRAINWVVTNRPLGEAFRSEWGGDTRVTIHTDDGHVIERVRSATRNEYIIDGFSLTAFGTEVPAEVTEILQIDSFNIQEQFDMPFLLFNTPGEVAKILNKAASIDDIDKTISGLKRSLNRINTDIASNEQLLKRQEAEMEQYANLPWIEDRLRALEELDKQKTALYTQNAGLRRILGRITSIEAVLSKTEHIPALIERYGALERKSSEYQEQNAQYQRLCRLAERIERGESALKQTEGVEDCLVRLTKADKKADDLKELKKRCIILRKLISDIRGAEVLINQLDKDIERASEEYARLTPDTCPLCGAPMREWEEH